MQGATVISRDDIAAMLSFNADKQRLGCEDEGCMAEIGGALGVDKLIVGQAGRMSDDSSEYIVNLRLMDVRKNEVENRVTESFRGEEEQLLHAVRHAVRSLLGIDVKGAGRLAVTSNEDAAAVFVDDLEKGKAPMPPLPDLSVGRHTIRLAKSGFYDWQSDFYVDPSETTATWAQLKPRPQAWYQKWWVWTIAGVVVAGAGSTAILLTRPAATTGTGIISVR